MFEALNHLIEHPQYEGPDLSLDHPLRPKVEAALTLIDQRGRLRLSVLEYPETERRWEFDQSTDVYDIDEHLGFRSYLHKNGSVYEVTLTGPGADPHLRKHIARSLGFNRKNSTEVVKKHNIGNFTNRKVYYATN